MECIEVIKKRLSINNTLIIQNEGGYFEEVLVEFNSPITIEEIIKFEKLNNITFPSSYKKFLQISNGAKLFIDIEFGQWGCVLLSLNEIIEKTNHVKEYDNTIKESWIVFAEWLGDGDILLFDLDKAKKTDKHYIIDGDEGYNANKWVYLNGDFENWIDRLIVAQGSKYWRW